jgi:hypothetical protein
MRETSLTAILAYWLAKLLLARLPFGIRPLRIVATRLWIRWLVHKYVMVTARALDKALTPVAWLFRRRGEPVDVSGEEEDRS